MAEAEKEKAKEKDGGKTVKGKKEESLRMEHDMPTNLGAALLKTTFIKCRRF